MSAFMITLILLTTTATSPAATSPAATSPAAASPAATSPAATSPAATRPAATKAADAREKTSSTANWPQWRGPQANGVGDGQPPLEWSEEKNIRWKIAVPGRGHATPITWGDRLFLTSAIQTDSEAAAGQGGESGVAATSELEFVALAYSRRDGSLLWRRTLRRAKPHEGTHAHGTWASGSMVTDGDVLVAHFGSNGTYALSLDGEPRWEVDLGDMQTRNGFGEGSSPVLDGDRIFINWDHEGESFLVALSRATGKELWRDARDEPTSWSTPLLVDGPNGRQLVVNATERTRGYDAATGKRLWEASGMTVNTIPSPVVLGSTVYVMSGFRGAALQAIDVSTAKGDVMGTKSVRWQLDRDTPYVPSPVIVDNQLCFLKGNKGILTCLDAITGDELYGRVDLELQGVYASPVAADGKIYFADRDGATVVIKTGPEFQLLARNQLDDGFDASPALVGRELYLRGRQNLYCIAEAD